MRAALWMMRLARAASLAVLLAAVLSVAARAVELPRTEISYRAAGQPLAEVLQDVALALDVPVQAPDAPDIMVRGDFRAPDAESFLDMIAEKYGLDWAFDGMQVHVSPQSARRERSFSFSSPGRLAGFLELVEIQGRGQGTDFPMPASADGTQIMVFASPFWLDTLSGLHADYAGYEGSQSVSGRMEGGGPDTGVMVFRLHNAWAEDKAYQLDDGSSFVIPGVVALLRGLAGMGNGAGQAQEMAQPARMTAALQPLPQAAGRRAAQDRMAMQGGRDAGSDAPPPAASGAPVIMADIRQNAIVIHDRLDRYDYYRSLIRDLDSQVKLVEIGAVIVDVAKSQIENLGVDWQLQGSSGSLGFGNVGGAVLQEGGIALSVGAGVLGSALEGGVDSLMARIRAMEVTGNSRIVSLPSVLTMDNLEAVIDSTEQFFLRVEGYQDSSLYPVSASTRMRVTPHVVVEPDGSYSTHMLVSVQDSAFDNSEDRMVDGLPLLRQNSVNTQAIVRQGDSLMIGGQVHNVEISTQSKVPLLGDLPLLGAAFRSRQTQSQEFVRLFLIRPVVRDRESTSALAPFAPSSLEPSSPGLPGLPGGPGGPPA